MHLLDPETDNAKAAAKSFQAFQHDRWQFAPSAWCRDEEIHFEWWSKSRFWINVQSWTSVKKCWMVFIKTFVYVALISRNECLNCGRVLGSIWIINLDWNGQLFREFDMWAGVGLRNNCHSWSGAKAQVVKSQTPCSPSLVWCIICGWAARIHLSNNASPPVSPQQIPVQRKRRRSSPHRE